MGKRERRGKLKCGKCRRMNGSGKWTGRGRRKWVGGGGVADVEEKGMKGRGTGREGGEGGWGLSRGGKGGGRGVE